MISADKDNHAPKYTKLEFLPSEYGYGFTTDISSHIGIYDDVGWPTSIYKDLKGVAIEPELERLNNNPWLV